SEFQLVKRSLPRFAGFVRLSTQVVPGLSEVWEKVVIEGRVLKISTTTISGPRSTGIDYVFAFVIV
ncbi:MAG: hypothetical protein AAF202_10405, partial [Pseudomonadota bacterium]